MHQLRNPLTALRTFSKLLLKRLLPEDRNRQVAQSLLRESDRLQDLVQEFEGSLAPIETSTLSPVQTDIALPAETAPILVPPLEASLAVPYQLKLASVAISEVLAPLLTSAEAIAQERNIALESAILIDLPPLQADAKALREVLSNN